MNRPAIDVANLRRQSPGRKRARWWFEHLVAAAVLLGLAFGIGTLQANLEGHNPHSERTTP